MELSYISGNRIPKKLFVLQKVTFRTQKIKTLKKTYIPPPKKKKLIKPFYNLSKAPLRKTGYLNNLYYLLAAQPSTIHFQSCFL